MQIGSVPIDGRAFLAPMAGVTDRAFRQICREQGAALTTSEMVSTRALLHQDRKSRRLLALAENETPGCVQIFGHEPESMAEGARRAVQLSGCALLDLNMGCPAPKITGNGDGSALLRDLPLAGRVIAAVVQAVDVPVTVKFRKGWDDGHPVYRELAHIAEESGAAALCLHGRTRAQQYSGTADWDCIREIKERAHIPVIANGDIASAQDALRALEQTGADAVMIGRAALGDPFLFAQLRAALRGEPVPEPPSFAVRMDTAVRQIELAAADKGEHIAMLEARKHVNWYLKGIPRLREYKKQVSALSALQELYALREQLRLEMEKRGA